MKELSQPPILVHVAHKVGGFAALARKLGISRQAVDQWKRIPAERVIEIEKLSQISRHELRPDLHPRESVA
jgi:DNA-binding transcriptional regulator YdaS (Cro superfamily)